MHFYAYNGAIKNFGGPVIMKKMLSLLLAFACLFGCACLFAACDNGTNTTTTAPQQKFIVATNTPFAPFEYIGIDGLAYGIDMEIAAGFAQSKGYALVIKDISFDSILGNVASGYSDIGMAGMTINDTRLATNDFTDTYYEASQMLIVAAGNTAFDACTTAAEVEAVLAALPEGTKLGYQNGTTGNWYVEGDEDWGFDGFANITATGYASAQQAVMDLTNGNIYGVVVDNAPAEMLVAAANGTVKLINISLTEEEYAFALKKGNTQLAEEFNAYLETIKTDGTLDAIISKYFGGTGTLVGYPVSDD